MSDEAAPQHANVLYPYPLLMMLLLMLLLMTLLQMADECFGCRWSCSTAAAGPSPVAQELGLTLELELELELGEVVAWLVVVVPHAAAPPQQAVRWRQPCAWLARELDGERRCAWT